MLEESTAESASSKADRKAIARAALEKGSRSDHRATNPRARCLDVAATAVFLGVNRRTVWRLVEHGTLRPIRLPGMRKVLFDVLELELVIEAAKQ